MIGSSVKAKVLIQSDDMSNGIDDGSLPVPVGTLGTIIGRSVDCLQTGEQMKPGMDQSLVVEFKCGMYLLTYDCLPEELEFV